MLSQCAVCGRTIEEGRTECSNKKCRFPVMTAIAGNPDQDAQNRRAADSFRAGKVKDYSYAIRTYAAKPVRDEFIPGVPQIITLAGIGQLNMRRAFWTKETFPMVDLASLDVTLVITDQHGKREISHVKVPMPKIEEDFKVGIIETEDGYVRILLGTPDDYSASKKINVLV